MVVLNKEAIVEANNMRLDGRLFKRNTKVDNSECEAFCVEGEALVKLRSGYNRNALPQPWNQMAEWIIRYITLDGRFDIVFGPHLILPSHFRWGKKFRICLPYFLAESVRNSVDTVKKSKEDEMRHQGLLYHMYRVALAKIPETPMASSEALGPKKEKEKKMKLSKREREGAMESQLPKPSKKRGKKQLKRETSAKKRLWEKNKKPILTSVCGKEKDESNSSREMAISQSWTEAGGPSNMEMPSTNAFAIPKFEGITLEREENTDEMVKGELIIWKEGAELKEEKIRKKQAQRSSTRLARKKQRGKTATILIEDDANIEKESANVSATKEKQVATLDKKEVDAWHYEEAECFFISVNNKRQRL